MTTVRCGLIQAALNADTKEPLETIRDRMLARHAEFFDQAGAQGVQILCAQEVFNAPYFCPEAREHWFGMAETVDGGPTVRMVREYARRHRMVIVAPIYELDTGDGHYYNTAVVVDADGSVLGKYRKTHIPGGNGNYEDYYFQPGNLGFPVFRTAYATIGVYICYDRHYPEGARILGLNGAQIVFIPAATWVSKSRHLWDVEQRALAANNTYFVGTINRVGCEAPWNLQFYGSSYFADPHGRVMAQAGEEDALLVADLDLALIDEARQHWGFERVRRPEVYGPLTTGPAAAAD